MSSNTSTHCFLNLKKRLLGNEYCTNFTRKTMSLSIIPHRLLSTILSFPVFRYLTGLCISTDFISSKIYNYRTEVILESDLHDDSMDSLTSWFYMKIPNIGRRWHVLKLFYEFSTKSTIHIDLLHIIFFLNFQPQTMLCVKAPIFYQYKIIHKLVQSYISHVCTEFQYAQ